jgi:polyhydroxyalkanoate synthesis repressor PhaR
MLVVKKYSNRRLYHTRESRYITLDELAETIREGEDVQVVDAKTSADLTQPTLAQIILDSRGASKLLPTELLTQLIRMGDDALAEFFGKYVSWALEMYVAARRGAQAVSPYFPLANVPFNVTNAMARMLSGHGPWSNQSPVSPPMPQPGPPPVEQPEGQQDRDARQDNEIASLRDEIEALKQAMTKAGGD